MRVRFWRYPAAEVPEDRDATIRWFYDKWLVLDDWVGDQRGSRAGTQPAGNAPAGTSPG